MLHIEHLAVWVGKKRILHDFSYLFEKNKTYIIMGPNGSGKSTLANVIMGHPQYEANPSSKIILSGKDITRESPEKRAQAGLFLSFQNPLAISGVTVFQLLRAATKGKGDPLSLQKKMYKVASSLKIKKELLERSLNVGASGGEKKKMEVLQAMVLVPSVALFDEVDTGVDIDALKTIASNLSRFRKGKTLILITHNSKIAHYINANTVLILKDGRLVKTGDMKLAARVEKEGFEHF
ncbi:Fe-S cluster assembly ATPase SufC [Candidatus Roizmanbacteria bacterium CG_4_10_14_0_8_um_filter_39_9]|uniref:Fe-S cluster assembly ATPase SufC n=1 Tax=Candidatus Roizmanbacteria bacterium CG_4_10_14_0_8_um_filter_39_9 TaxID=1974829 RepID=A0A2M7QEP0_9BACT|nr:MAG: Fe-S cluster assembly ATPase SufC [Candidatus Roizmanbacteria bacterium CG_4_10_14_0_8_um_filter_39_9]